MNSSQKKAMTYANIELETGVATGDPHKLILMLFEGAFLALSDARKSLDAKNIPAKGMAISKAIRIIDEGLKASLDEKTGGEIAGHLMELYDYMCRRLLIASLRNEVEPIFEVAKLLIQLKQAWETIGQKSVTASSEQNIEINIRG
jgi:flagellar protein FliS